MKTIFFTPDTDFSFTGYGKDSISVFFNNGSTVFEKEIDKIEFAESNGYDIGAGGFWADDNFIGEDETIDGVPVEYWMPSSDEVLFHIEADTFKKKTIDNALKSLFEGFGQQYKTAV